MHRRLFLQQSAALATTSLLAGPVRALDTLAPTPDWSLGWRSVDVDRMPPLALSLEGNLPAQLHGHLYRNGPARTERGGVRYQHWFDGDGMIQDFHLSSKGITHQGRFVQTRKYLREQKAGRFLYRSAGTVVPDAEPAGNNDTANVANTALLPWDDELLALWEGGSAYRVDPATLDTLGRKDWRDDLIHMPFSAHPLLEKDGTMWNVGAAPYVGKDGKLFVYHISPNQGVLAMQAIDLPVASYLHSFAMTERYLVFYLGPHRYEHGAATFVDSFAWSPELGSKILLVDKNDLTARRWFEAPAGFVFHCAAAYELGSQVVAPMCVYPTAEVMQAGMNELMHGNPAARYPVFPRAQLTTLRLDLKTGKATSEASGTLLEFPGTDPRQAGSATAIFGVGHSPDAPPTYSDAIVRVEPEGGRVTRYAFPEHHIVEEPLFVPGSGRRDSGGYLVGSFLDFQKAQTGIFVLEANNLEAGPIAMARMERSLPLGFHGCFVPA